MVPESLRGSARGTIVEICPAALALANMLGARFAGGVGAALFIDYGHSQSTAGPSLRAVRQHRAVCALDGPGAADLSAYVDFAAFAGAARTAGAEIYGPVPQGGFLAALGAGLRLAKLREHATPRQRRLLENGAKRLLDPDEMGNLFKVMALASSCTG